MSHSSSINAQIINLNASFSDEAPILSVEESANTLIITTTDDEVVEEVGFMIDELFSEQYTELSINLDDATISITL